MPCPKPHYHIEPCDGGSSGIALFFILAIVLIVGSWLAKHAHTIENVLRTILIIAIVCGCVSFGALITFIIYMLWSDRPKKREATTQPIQVHSVRIISPEQSRAKLTDGSNRIPESVTILSDYRRTHHVKED